MNTSFDALFQQLKVKSVKSTTDITAHVPAHNGNYEPLVLLPTAHLRQKYIITIMWRKIINYVQIMSNYVQIIMSFDTGKSPDKRHIFMFLH